jgi:hypothetical protein
MSFILALTIAIAVVYGGIWVVLLRRNIRMREIEERASAEATEEWENPTMNVHNKHELRTSFERYKALESIDAIATGPSTGINIEAATEAASRADEQPARRIDDRLNRVFRKKN